MAVAARAAWFGGSYGISFWNMIVLPVLAFPEDVVVLVVARRRARDRVDVVGRHDEAHAGDVGGPPDAGAVVSPPGPDVVEDRVVRDRPRGSAALLPALRSADPEEDVLECTPGSFGFNPLGPWPPPQLQQCRSRVGRPASKMRPAIVDPVSHRRPSSGRRRLRSVSVAITEPEHDRVGVGFTLIVLSML